jgi:hypothetical protein
LCTLCVLLFAIGGGDTGQPRRPVEVRPVDEAVTDPDLLAVRRQVLDSLQRHDVERLLAVMADDVRFHHGALQTKTMTQASLRSWFTDLWKFEPRVSEGLVKALTLGGSFTTTRGSVDRERQFCAPYVYSAFPFSVDRDLLRYPDDGYGVGVLIAKDIPVRRRPGDQSPIVARVSYRLVHFATVEGDRDAQREISWEHIITEDGVDGYVPASVVRRPNDYYVCFAQRAGAWRVTEFGQDRYPGEP